MRAWLQRVGLVQPDQAVAASSSSGIEPPAATGPGGGRVRWCVRLPSSATMASMLAGVYPFRMRVVSLWRLRLARQKLAASWDSQDGLLMGMSNLVDAELAAGNAHAAAETGRALVARHEAGRDEYHLNWARLNLCAALLALDATEEDRRMAEAGWSHAKRFELQGCWADYLALPAALESRPVAAAQLCGFSIAAYATGDELREVNVAAAFDRARGIAIGAIGERRFELLQIEGQTMRYEDIATIAFGGANVMVTSTPGR